MIGGGKIMKRTVTLVDSTLRDGAQCPHLALSAAARVHIARALVGIGITDIEAGSPATGEAECALIGQLTEEFSTCRVIAWCRARSEDLMTAKQCGAKAVHIAFPLSPIQLKTVDWSNRRLFEQLDSLLALAGRHFAWVSVGAMDASRCPPDLLIRFASRAVKLGAARLRIADTVGILTPSSTMQLVRRLARCIDPAILEFHAHNDLGMATANTISALQAGAGAASVTVNGIGERAGNAALEQIAVALHMATNLHATLRLSGLQRLCEDVARHTGVPIEPEKPITGAWVFTHQSGIHCRGLLADPAAFEPFRPSLTGHAPSQTVVGTHSGGASVIATLAGTDASLTKTEARNVAAVARKMALELGRTLTAGEVFALATEKKLVPPMLGKRRETA